MGEEGTPDPPPARKAVEEEPEQDARILSGVRRSMRIMQLQQKSGNLAEEKGTSPRGQVGGREVPAGEAGLVCGFRFEWGMPRGKERGAAVWCRVVLGEGAAGSG